MPPNGQGKWCINLLEVETVRDVVCSHETGQQVSDSSSFTTVRSELECVHTSLPGRHKHTAHSKVHLSATFLI